MDAYTLSTVGAILIFAGFVIVFLAFLLLLFKSARGTSRTKGGAVVLLGPFPIVFGTDKESVKLLLVLSIILILVAFFFMFALHHMFGSGGM